MCDLLETYGEAVSSALENLSEDEIAIYLNKRYEMKIWLHVSVLFFKWAYLYLRWRSERSEVIPNMIYITGDTHGDFSKFGNSRFTEGKFLTREDFVIICGDFGGVWDGSRRDQYWLDWIESKPFTLLFVDGNHENFDLLNSFPCDEWKGGKVHVLRENILHLMRGQVFNIAGKKFFTMGGAASHDVWDGILDPDDLDFSTTYWRMRRNGSMFRVKGIDWWPEEMPSDSEYAEAIRNLESVGWDIDYVITHCAPTSLLNKISTSYRSDQLTDFLQLIKRMSPKTKWFCGHYHQDMQITDHFQVLYNKIIHI